MSVKQIEGLKRMLRQCEDSTLDGELRKKYRQLGRQLAQKNMEHAVINELEKLLQSVLVSIQQDRKNVERVCASRMEDMVSKLIMENGEDSKMAIVEKLKSLFSGKEKNTQSSMLEKEEAEAEQTIFLLQKNIADLYDRHTDLLREMERKVKNCTGIARSSDQFKLIRQEANILVPQIRAVEKQLQLYSNALDSNARYHAMLQTGKASFELKKIMPDINKMEAMLDWIQKETEDIADTIDIFKETVDEQEQSIQKLSGDTVTESGTMFDDMVQAEQEMQKSTETEMASEQAKFGEVEVI